MPSPRTRRKIGLALGAVVLGAVPLAFPAAAAVPGRAAAARPAAPSVPVLLAQPFPVVRSGSHGQPVRSLQYLLRARGRTVVVDGSFGPATDRAVRAFQRSRGLPVDGVVGARTWRALVVTVQRGSRGDAVRAVQDQAQFRNLSGDPRRGVAVDGTFGPATERFVRGFQRADGLAVDGVVGPRTWQALIAGDLSG